MSTDFQILIGDALEQLRTLPEASVDCVVTSPPYNFGKNYGGNVNDNIPMDDYFYKMGQLARELKRVMTLGGIVFLNVGTRAKDPIHDVKVAQEFIWFGWVIQERIIWQKASEDGTGHFTPIPGDRHLNNVWESIFVLTKTGDIPMDRLAIGVPYKDKTNTARWKHGRDLRCRGDLWFIPYETIQNRNTDRNGHEATFPSELVIRCLKLVAWGCRLTVLDPYCGTGTVPLAAVLRGHRAIGIEINPTYAAMARHRIEAAVPGPALSHGVGDGA